MKRYIIFLILATMAISSVPLFSATREEAIAYYENKYAKELEEYRRTGYFGVTDERGMVIPLSEAMMKERAQMSELGLFNKYTKMKLGSSTVSVPWNIYYEISDKLATITDEKTKEALEEKYAQAAVYSKNFDLDFHCALENLDAIEKAYSKVEKGYFPTPTKGREILDSIRDFFDESYETTWEKHDKAEKSQEDFERFLDNLRDNWFEI